MSQWGWSDSDLDQAAQSYADVRMRRAEFASFQNGTDLSAAEFRTMLKEQEVRIVSEFDQKLNMLTAKLDAMMEEIRLLPGGTDYMAAMQRLHATEEVEANVLAGAASAGAQ